MSPRATYRKVMGKRNAGEWHACQRILFSDGAAFGWLLFRLPLNVNILQKVNFCKLFYPSLWAGIYSLIQSSSLIVTSQGERERRWNTVGAPS